MLEHATIDGYDEDEEFNLVLSTLATTLNLSLQAETLGFQAEVIGLEARRSRLRKGIVARAAAVNTASAWLI